MSRRRGGGEHKKYGMEVDLNITTKVLASTTRNNQGTTLRKDGTCFRHEFLVPAFVYPAACLVYRTRYPSLPFPSPAYTIRQVNRYPRLFSPTDGFPQIDPPRILISLHHGMLIQQLHFNGSVFHLYGEGKPSTETTTHRGLGPRLFPQEYPRRSRRCISTVTLSITLATITCVPNIVHRRQEQRRRANNHQQ